MKITNYILISISLIKFCLNTICEDGLECPDNYTCCKGASRYSCCPLENAICCGDGFHCCPQGTKCNDQTKKCDKLNENLDLIYSLDYVELTPTSLIYKKGWNELYYNCASDLKLIKHDLINIFFDLLSGNKQSLIRAGEEIKNLIADGKVTTSDCLKFFKEVFE